MDDTARSWYNIDMRHNWDRLFAHRGRVVVPSAEFAGIGNTGYCQQVRNQAYQRGLYVSVVDDGYQIVVWIREKSVKQLRAEKESA